MASSEPTPPLTSPTPTVAPTVQLASPSAPSAQNDAQVSSVGKDARLRSVKLEWDDQTEEMVAGWTDVAACYKWLHTQAFHKYDRINFTFNVPISIFSTISGVVSVGMASLVPPDYVDLAQKAVGGVNVFTGILTYFQTYLKFGQKIESHSHAALGWSKLERNMRIELKIDRSHRKEADSFIKVCRSEYDRLIEQSPVIPEDVVHVFKRKFAKQTALIKPEICDNIMHTEITKPAPEPEREPTPEPEPILPTYPSQPHEEVLREIKELLAESRIVPIGIKDSQLAQRTVRVPTYASSSDITGTPTPTWRTSTIDETLIKPRKSFLEPPPLIRYPTDVDRTSMPSVKSIAAQFERKQTLFTPSVPSSQSASTPASLSQHLESVVARITSDSARPSESARPSDATQPLETIVEITATPASSEPTTPRAEIIPIQPTQKASSLQINDLL